MTSLRLGLVGCGVMGGSLARACNELETARIAAIADIVPANVNKVAGEIRGETVKLSDYHDLLARSDLDAVLVAVPQFLHTEIALAAAQAGKHVFVEKPMAVTLADCDAIIAACASAGVKLMVGHVCRYHAVHSRVKRFVDEGEVGALACLSMRRLGTPWGGPWHQRWRDERAKCGGVLMEVNAHELDFLRWVGGEVRSVVARGAQYLDAAQDYEDTMLVTLNFTSGAVGHLHSSNAAALSEYGGRVDGTEGSLVFDRIWGEGAGIRHGKFGEEPQFLSLTHIEHELPVRAELRAFADAVLNDHQPPIPGGDGRAVVELALAAYRSAATGELVELG